MWMNILFFLPCSMFSKTWRVHAIFTDIKLNKKVSLFVSYVDDQMYFTISSFVVVVVVVVYDSSSKITSFL